MQVTDATYREAVNENADFIKGIIAQYGFVTAEDVARLKTFTPEGHIWFLVRRHDGRGRVPLSGLDSHIEFYGDRVRDVSLTTDTIAYLRELLD